MVLHAEEKHGKCPENSDDADGLKDAQEPGI
jgi:hypothetical protein